jgi:hypothetical protein
MVTQVKTERFERTWRDKVLFWQRPYRTRISNEYREVVGEGSTEWSAVESAYRQWIEGARDSRSVDNEFV